MCYSEIDTEEKDQKRRDAESEPNKYINALFGV